MRPPTAWPKKNLRSMSEDQGDVVAGWCRGGLSHIEAKAIFEISRFVPRSAFPSEATPDCLGEWFA
jgi:hypothetical protein